MTTAYTQIITKMKIISENAAEEIVHGANGKDSLC